MSIVILALFTAFCSGLFAAEIIWTAVTYSKAARYKNRIKIKDAHQKYIAEAAVLFCFLVLTLNTLVSLYKYDFDFTEKIKEILKTVMYGQMSLILLFDLLFGSKAYITDDGIITTAAFFRKGKAKYEIEKSETESFILLYTKKAKHDFSFMIKPKYENDIINVMNYLDYEKFDGTSPNLKKQSYIKRNLIILLCTAFLFVGGLFGWYAAAKPVVIVGDVIVKTNSEQALLDSNGCMNLLFSHDLKYFPELEQNYDKITDGRQHTQSLTSKDMAALKQMPNLKYLCVTQNNIDDLTDIGELTQLEMLAIGSSWGYVTIPELYSPLKNLTGLKYFVGLDLYSFNDLTVFESMDNLEYFELTDAEIQMGLDVICEKENLLVLNLSRCKIDDFSPIGKCAKLKTLNIGKTNVDDLSFLKNLRELEYLYISDIDVNDYSVLLDLPQLKYVFAWDTKLPQEVIDKLTEKGIKCDVRD